MADDAGPAPIAHPPAVVPARERGTTTISDRVVSQIARRATASATGTTAQTTGLGRLTGRSLPRVEVTRAADRLRLTTQIAAGWPAPLPVVAQRTSAAITRDVERLTGMKVDGVDVTVEAVQTEGGLRARPEPISPGTPHLPPRAPAPVRPAPGGLAGPVVAVALLAGSAVLLRDALAHAGIVDGLPWTTTALTRFGIATPQAWHVPAGIALALIGIALLALALKGRRVSELEVGESGYVWTRTDDLARLAARAAESVPGIVRASATAQGSRIVVTGATTTTRPADLESQVHQAVATRIAGTGVAVPVAVRLESVGAGR